MSLGDQRPSTAAMSEHRYCLGCGYDLTGLAEPRCPECAQEFDLSDPATFLAERVNGRRWLFCVLLWALLYLASAVAAYTANTYRSEDLAEIALFLTVYGFCAQTWIFVRTSVLRRTPPAAILHRASLLAAIVLSGLLGPVGLTAFLLLTILLPSR